MGYAIKCEIYCEAFLIKEKNYFMQSFLIAKNAIIFTILLCLGIN